MKDSIDSLLSNQITFFVVTTLYKSNGTIQKTFDSMLAQTFSHIVHYIYDDGSPENPDAIVDSYIKAVKERKQPYTVIYEKGFKNLGVDFAHQHGFQKMTGTHFMWLDSGDYLDPRYFEIVERAIRSHPECTWFHTNVSFYSPKKGVFLKNKGKQYHLCNLRRKDQRPFGLSGRDFFYHHHVVSVSAYRSINPQMIFLDGHLFGGLYYDGQIFQALAAAEQKGCYLAKPLSFIQDVPGSAGMAVKIDLYKQRKGIKEMFRYLALTDEQKRFANGYYDFLDLSVAVEGHCLTGETQKAIQSYKDTKKYLKDNQLPHYYFVNQSRAKRFYIFARLPILLRLYKKIRHLSH
jgi:glycosyltransferase involved in cell wall biosynthesis